MSEKDTAVNWEKIIGLYNTVKDLYALCEEVDPELNTNLQPLNEFRAALDHLMRICAINNLEEYSEYGAAEQANSLYGHLKRAFFDICDLITIFYRNKIIDMLNEYDKDDIHRAIPTYYSEIRPYLEQVSNEIAKVRTESRFKSEDNFIDTYCNIIGQLDGYYKAILLAESSLIELKETREKEKKKSCIVQVVIPVASIIIGAVIGFVGFFL